MSGRLRVWVIFFSALLSLHLGYGCAVQINPQTPSNISPVPVTMEFDAISADYAADYVRADEQYSKQRMYFYHLTVDRIVSAAATRYIAIGNLWFESGYYSYLTNVGEGSVVDISGQCDSYSCGQFIFRD